MKNFVSEKKLHLYIDDGNILKVDASVPMGKVEITEEADKDSIVTFATTKKDFTIEEDLDIKDEVEDTLVPLPFEGTQNLNFGEDVITISDLFKYNSDHFELSDNFPNKNLEKLATLYVKNSQYVDEKDIEKIHKHYLKVSSLKELAINKAKELVRNEDNNEFKPDYKRPALTVLKCDAINAIEPEDDKGNVEIVLKNLNLQIQKYKAKAVKKTILSSIKENETEVNKTTQNMVKEILETTSVNNNNFDELKKLDKEDLFPNDQQVLPVKMTVNKGVFNSNFSLEFIKPIKAKLEFETNSISPIVVMESMRVMGLFCFLKINRNNIKNCKFDNEKIANLRDISAITDYEKPASFSKICQLSCELAKNSEQFETLALNNSKGIENLYTGRS